MQFTRLARGAAIVAAAAMALSACARSSDEPTNSDRPDQQANAVQPGYFPQADGGEPVPGGTLTLADLSEVRTLDPSKVIPTGASGGSALVAVYDQVMRLNVETGQYEPRLAESVSPNEDHTEWTIKLRPEITFSDGTPLNADAMVGSFNWYLQQKGFDLSMIGPLWGGAEKVDDLTVKVTLKESWANFPGMLARQLGWIVAPAAIAGGPDGFRPIGAGAFTFGSYKPGEELILEANPNHWDGAPYLEKLRFVWLGADQTKYEAFKGKSVHAAYVIDPVIVEEIATTELPHYTIVANNGQVVMINQAEGNPGANAKVRKAMSFAVDPKVIADRSVDGKGYYGKTMFAPISKWNDGSVQVNEYNPEEARKLVEEAKAEGFDGKINVLASDSPVNRETVMTMKAQWDAVGLETETEFTRNLADYISRLFVERKYSIAQVGLQAVDVDPYLNLYSAFSTNGASNLTNATDEEMDALIAELRATPTADEAAVQDVINRIEARYQDQVPMITFRYFTPTTVWQDNVHGIVGLNEMMTGYGKAWIQE